MSKSARLTVVVMFLAVVPLAILAAVGRDKPEGRRGPGIETSGPATPAAAVKGLTEQQEEELMTTLKDTQPDYYKRLSDLKGSNPSRYRWALKSLWPWYQRFRNAPKEIQKALINEQEAKVEIWRIVRDLGQTKDPAETAKLTTDLKAAVSQQFNAEQVLRENRLNELEQQIKHLREELQQRRDQREQILDQRVQDLLKGPAEPAGDHKRGPISTPSGRSGHEERPARTDG
jgi:hypothetical protein